MSKVASEPASEPCNALIAIFEAADYIDSTGLAITTERDITYYVPLKKLQSTSPWASCSSVLVLFASSRSC